MSPRIELSVDGVGEFGHCFEMFDFCHQTEVANATIKDCLG